MSAKDEPDKTATRRAALGGMAAAAVGAALLRPSDASAASGSPLILGQTNTQSSGTILETTVNNQYALALDGDYHQLACFSTSGAGVFGRSEKLIGLWGNGGATGVLGQSDTDTGVSGMSGSDTGAGVRALNFGTGPALKVEGPAVFSRSGVATIAGTSAAPLQSVSIKVPGPTATGGVIATLKTHVPGVHVEAAVSTGLRTWKIWLNKPLASSVDVVWIAIG